MKEKINNILKDYRSNRINRTAALEQITDLLLKTTAEEVLIASDAFNKAKRGLNEIILKLDASNKNKTSIIWVLSLALLLASLLHLLH